MCGGLAAPKACSRGARRREKGIDGGGERSHRSLSPSANRPAQLAGATHPPQTHRPHPHCPPARRDVPRAVAAPSPALLVSKSTAVDSVTTWVLRLRRDGHIAGPQSSSVEPSRTVYDVKFWGKILPTDPVSPIQYDLRVTGRLTAAIRRHTEWKSESTDQLE